LGKNNGFRKIQDINMDYKGVIIEESLKDKSVLKEIKILRTISEKVTKIHRTPWLSQWTIHNVLVSEEKIDLISEKIQKSLDDSHEWYVELKNKRNEIMIFHDNIIKKRLPLF
jgi:hypothetical protein